MNLTRNRINENHSQNEEKYWVVNMTTIKVFVMVRSFG